MSLVFSGPLRANRPRRNAVLVATGTNFSTAIDGYGRAWGWGVNSSGQVGDNATLSRSAPVTVAGAKKTFCKIDSGTTASLAIDKYGQVWAWGAGSSGQLGCNSTVSQLTPVSIAGNKKTFCEIAISLGLHSMGIDKYGQIWAWGDGSNGRLGNNSTVSAFTPISLLGAKKTFCKVDVGNAWTAAIDKYGQVWCWGNGGDGRLGRNSTVSFLTPVSITGQKKTFCHISAGNATTAGIDRYGIIWSWGFNNSGQLGNAANTAVWTPVSLAGARKTFCKINLGNGQTIAIDQYGQAWGWGFNTSGLIGNGTNFAFNTPVRVCCNITFCEISAGSQHSTAVDKNKRLWGWGPYSNGQLGNNDTLTFVDTPVSLAGAKKTFCEISYSSETGYAIDIYGRAWGWGYQNTTMQRVGDGTTINRATPVSIVGAVKTFCKIGSGTQQGYAIDKYGRAWAWGSGNNYGLAQGASFTNYGSPVSVRGAVKTFCKITGGFNNGLAIDRYGILWVWGYNAQGVLGQGTTLRSDPQTPVSVKGARKTFCEVCTQNATNGWTAAIDRYGQMWVWGINSVGQLGQGQTTTPVGSPISIGGAKKTFCKVAVSGASGLAIDKYGQIWGWGNKSAGQLGDNTSTGSALTPISIGGAKKTFCEITAGRLAIDVNKKVWGWGTNTSGSLGLNSSIDSVLTPVRMYGDKTFCKIQTGQSVYFGLDQNSLAVVGGSFVRGKVGNGRFDFRTMPVQVCNI